MLKLLKYMKKNAGYLILVFVLLFLQAYCELSLPSYTSDIVDIGIQQKGIPDAVPEQIRTSAMEELMSLMSESEANEVARVYVKDQDLYVQKEMNEKERDKVNEILGCETSDPEDRFMMKVCDSPDGLGPRCCCGLRFHEAHISIRPSVKDWLCKRTKLLRCRHL